MASRARAFFLAEEVTPVTGPSCELCPNLAQLLQSALFHARHIHHPFLLERLQLLRKLIPLIVKATGQLSLH